jgi:hypothetical protein
LCTSNRDAGWSAVANLCSFSTDLVCESDSFPTLLHDHCIANYFVVSDQFWVSDKASMAQDSKLQIVFNVGAQLLGIGLAVLFGAYTVLSYFATTSALQQAILSNQLALTIFCQTTVSLGVLARTGSSPSQRMSGYSEQFGLSTSSREYKHQLSGRTAIWGCEFCK